MKNHTGYILASILLTTMLALAYFSMLGDSMTMDEVAHLPAGYSYITQKDMRLNPEHPPLIKDMSGIGVWFWSKISGTKINFPANIKAWKDDINGQWDFGFNFMYRSANDADKMLLYGRLPMLLILLILGIYIFKWTKELFGNQTAILALFLYTLSPTFIAHGRLVTTDVAASLAIFVALYHFINWLKNPHVKNLFVAGVVLGISLLAKFSVFLLIPLFAFLIIIWIIFPRQEDRKSSEFISSYNFWKKLTTYVGGFIVIGIIALMIIYLIYLPHVWNYPQVRQINDMRFILHSYANGPDRIPFESCKNIIRIKRCPAEIVIWMAKKPILRPLAQYFYGLLMVVQRAAGGNTTYFLGEVSAAGWPIYFPIVYAIKEPLTLHILTIIALLFAAYSLKEPFWKNAIQRTKNWIRPHIAEFSMLSFIFLYWYSSISSPLNIGVRHVLPTFPFIYILVSNQIVKWLNIKKPESSELTTYEKIKFIEHAFFGSILKYGLLTMLLIWQFISVITIYPYFLTYFNELIGGPKNGYLYVVDSNLDWGQDFKRLAKWVNERHIETIYIDYFGGTVGEYYLGDKLKPWSGDRNPNDLPPKSYLAVSATLLQGGRGAPAPGYTSPTGYYNWLNQYQPVEIIGNSIFVYYIP